jgi:hypothetical protein
MNTVKSVDASPQAGQLQRVSFWQTVASVLWAFYGVQNDKNRARDFNHGNAMTFIAVGFALTAVFMLVLIGIVKLLMANAGMT